jgi:serine/threonine protein kinase
MTHDRTSDTTSIPGFEVLSKSGVQRSIVLPDGLKQEPLGSGFITKILGTGGMANVYEIWNSQLEVNRAVKLLHPNYTEETKQRFQTEIKITAKLHHPNIIEIHAVGQWSGIPYIEMERIDGLALDVIIRRMGALPVEVCTSIAIMIGRALRYAHNQDYIIYGKNYHGVIHRDLKPSNVMISHIGSVKLMDFGIARPTDASIHTTDGSILGTMQYLSPEQLEGKECDIRADIYSLGTVLYELLTGLKAFPEQNVSRLMLSKIKNQYKPLDTYDVKIPPKLRKLVHHCLVHNRSKRIQDATEFLSEIIPVHKSITQATPESILSDFMRNREEKRTEVSLRKRLPRLITGLFIATSVIILAIIAIKPLVHKYASKKSTANQTSLQESNSGESSKNSRSFDSTQKLITTPEKQSHNSVQKSNVPVTISQKRIPSDSSDNQITTLMSRYGTNDKGFLYVKLVQDRKFKDAKEIFSLLSPDEITDKIRIYRIHALRESGLQKELKEALFSKEIHDGEYYLECAKHFINNNEYGKAIENLTQCTHIPAAFIGNDILHIEQVYYTAICKSKEFDLNPSKDSKKAALDSWFEVKSELQTSKDHPYFKTADSEMQRITQK